MQCPYCLEEIKDGALVCRFCGKNQPLTDEAKKAWAVGRRPKVIVAMMAVVIVALMIVAGTDYRTEQQRLQEAADCNGSLTPQQIEGIARQTAASGDMSIREAERTAEVAACPRMAKE